MANTFLNSDVIARQALANLYSTTVAAGLVNRDHDNEFVAGRGDTITIRKPTKFVVNDFDPGTPAITVQDATETSVALQLTKYKDVSFAVTSKQMALDIENFNTQLLNPAMEAMSQQIDVDVNLALQVAAQATPTQEVGAIAAQLDALDTVAARTFLTAADAPMAQRYAIWGAVAEGELLKDPLFHQADQRGDTSGLLEASIGRKFGIDHFTSNNNPVATGGSTQDGGLVFHRNAVILAFRSLPPAQGADSSVVGYKGFGLRVTIDYDIDKKQDVVSIDCLYGTVTAYPDLAVEMIAGAIV